MNNHLAIICILPTALFAGGSFLYFVGTKFPIPEDNTLRNIGSIFMIGAIVIALQALYSLYLG